MNHAQYALDQLKYRVEQHQEGNGVMSSMMTAWAVAYQALALAEDRQSAECNNHPDQ